MFLQVMLLQHLPSLLNVFSDVFPALEVCQHFTRLVECICLECDYRIHHEKLKCLKSMLATPLYGDRREFRIALLSRGKLT